MGHYASSIGKYVKEMRIWCGKLVELSEIPPWIQWSKNHPGAGSDLCVVLVLVRNFVLLLFP